MFPPSHVPQRPRLAGNLLPLHEHNDLLVMISFVVTYSGQIQSCLSFLILHRRICTMSQLRKRKEKKTSSDQQVISPHNIHTKSDMQVMRIKVLIRVLITNQILTTRVIRNVPIYATVIYIRSENKFELTSTLTSRAHS